MQVKNLDSLDLIGHSVAPACVIDIGASGDVAFVWDDRLAALADEGKCQVTRASHVEPEQREPEQVQSGQPQESCRPYGPGKCLRWVADLRPVGGPVLGPFLLRGEALAAEREWLEGQDLLELAELAHMAENS